MIGAFGPAVAEGISTVSHALRKSLGRLCEVEAFATQDVIRPATIQAIRRFSPDVIHYVAGPRLPGLLLLRTLKSLLPRSLTVASATRPYLTAFDRALLPLIKPDLVLTQAARWEDVFRGAGIACRFVPNGVDRARFAPLAEPERAAVKRALGFPEDRPTILHVGHVKANRGVGELGQVVRLGYHCVLVGSAELSERRFADALAAQGVRVIVEFQPRIEQYYQAADGYLFPLRDLPRGVLPSSHDQMGVIDLPLSVLEAASSGTSIITTRYGGLERLLGDRDGVEYWDGAPESLGAAIARGIRTRPDPECVPSWDTVAAQVAAEYEARLRA